MNAANRIPSGTFGSGDKTRPQGEPRAIWQPKESDVFELTVPPDERPSSENLPGSIEDAILQVLDQVPRSPSAPELPPLADRYRR